MFDRQRERFAKLIKRMTKEYDDLLTVSILNDKDKQLLTYIRANRDLDDDLLDAKFEIQQLNEAIEADTTGLHQLLDKLGARKSKYVGDKAYDGAWSRLEDFVGSLKTQVHDQKKLLTTVRKAFMEQSTLFYYQQHGGDYMECVFCRDSQDDNGIYYQHVPECPSILLLEKG